MKSLVGTWKGMVDIGQGPIEMVSQYRLLSGGSVLEEKVFAGTPNEMTTMFYDKDGKLALTHYCMFGNRPAMVLKSADGKSIQFAFDKACGIDVKTESHMHAMTLTFDDADTITASCKSFMDGKEMPEKSHHAQAGEIIGRVFTNQPSRGSAAVATPSRRLPYPAGLLSCDDRLFMSGGVVNHLAAFKEFP